ncbi:BTB/POZ domain-containing protein KCTD14 [Ochotona curzoniae]|uniref:BTB/POZ domain-containing protein KCTD14 n=1 Tax=Ochotona curzoniae TaxID=130825 RepID=UPI001B351DCD|nr:BTB/POZ domain-containing protein KCTD14 [Ochotona curzoniae]
MMSLCSGPRPPASKSPAPPTRTNGQNIIKVVELNVGGQLYTTTLDTLRKFPDSKLAEMFSGSVQACRDARGCFFIDRPGTYFGPILDYLRSGQLPTQHISSVYREAQFYEIKPLIKLLEDTPQIFGEQVARRQFLLKVPGYREDLELMVRLARARAVAQRCSTIKVCVMFSEQHSVKCPVTQEADTIVMFATGMIQKDVSDLMDCVKMDLQNQGYQVSYHGPFFKSSSFASLPSPLDPARNCSFEFIFTWW